MNLLSYTRKPKEDIIYGSNMAYSIHLAYQGVDGKFRPFHHNEELLYAKALQNPEDGTLDAKCLKKPWVFELCEKDRIRNEQKDSDNNVICSSTEAC